MQNIFFLDLVNSDEIPEIIVGTTKNNPQSANTALFFFGMIVGIILGIVGFYIYTEIKQYFLDKKTEKDNKKDYNEKDYNEKDNGD